MRPHLTAAMALLITASAGVVGCSRNPGVAPSAAASAAAGAVPAAAGPQGASAAVWSGLDPAEFAAARRAFDERVAAEERDARARTAAERSP